MANQITVTKHYSGAVVRHRHVGVIALPLSLEPAAPVLPETDAASPSLQLLNLDGLSAVPQNHTNSRIMLAPAISSLLSFLLSLRVNP